MNCACYCMVGNWRKMHCVYFTCSTSSDGNLAGMLLNDEGESDPLPLDQSLYYMQQILQGVYHLHSCNIVHLDIKGCFVPLMFNFCILVYFKEHTTLWNENTSLIGTHLQVPPPLKPLCIPHSEMKGHIFRFWNEDTYQLRWSLYIHVPPSVSKAPCYPFSHFFIQLRVFLYWRVAEELNLQISE